MFQACVRLGSSDSNSEVQHMRSFLRQFDLDMSNLPHDPDFDVADRITHLSFIYGIHSFVRFNVVVDPYNMPDRIIHMAIHKLDEIWMHTNYHKYRNEVNLARFYQDFIQLYDQNLDSMALATRIVQSEDVVRRRIEASRIYRGNLIATTVGTLGNFTKDFISPAHWDRLIKLYTNNTYKSSTLVVLVDNVTAVAKVLVDTSHLARDDARLLMSWSIVHRLMFLAHGKEMIRQGNLVFGGGPEAITELCYDQLIHIMALAVSKRYFRKYVPAAALRSATRLMNDLVEALVRKATTTAWFKEPVRNLTLLKAANLSLTVGLPEELIDDAYVEALFADFPEAHGNFFTPYVESYRIVTKRSVRGNYTGENYKTVEANAFYHPRSNGIWVFSGILQPPFFFFNAPPAMNYGGIGVVLAHEIMHGNDISRITFNNLGRRVIKNRNSAVMKEFDRRVLCLRGSYQKEESESRARTVSDEIDSEGFADFTGTLLAYDAFRRLPDSERTKTVPYVGLTWEQTFFVANCLKWCDIDKDNKRRKPNALYWHSRSRCNVPLQNMPQFARAFSCAAGDAMNPAQRCDFW
ncbi:neprilysin-1-like [Amblyomma americanum]